MERGANITIIAGGGVDDEALAVFVDTGCVREVHVGGAARRDGTAGRSGQRMRGSAGFGTLPTA